MSNVHLYKHRTYSFTHTYLVAPALSDIFGSQSSPLGPLFSQKMQFARSTICWPSGGLLSTVLFRTSSSPPYCWGPAIFTPYHYEKIACASCNSLNTLHVQGIQQERPESSTINWAWHASSTRCINSTSQKKMFPSGICYTSSHGAYQCFVLTNWNSQARPYKCFYFHQGTYKSLCHGYLWTVTGYLLRKKNQNTGKPSNIFLSGPTESDGAKFSCICLRWGSQCSGNTEALTLHTCINNTYTFAFDTRQTCWTKYVVLCWKQIGSRPEFSSSIMLI